MKSILLLMVTHIRFLTKIVPVKTAFLHGDLKEEIYMECPQGMTTVRNKDCIVLNKCIYSLVQVPRQCYKKTIEILKNGTC